MRILLFAAALAACSFTACKKEPRYHHGLQGVYTGKFYRDINGHENMSAVTLKFTGNTWQGQSEYPYYPALCNGTFTTKGDKAQFTNSCMWIAAFDWTFILQDQWDLRYYGDSLRMTRTTDTYKDIYLLKRK